VVFLALVHGVILLTSALQELVLVLAKINLLIVSMAVDANYVVLTHVLMPALVLNAIAAARQTLNVLHNMLKGLIHVALIVVTMNVKMIKHLAKLASN
jgi:hypothetical protein